MRIPFFWNLTLGNWVIPDVSKEHTAFIFKGQEVQEHLDLLTLEDEGSTLLRNVGTGIYRRMDYSTTPL